MARRSSSPSIILIIILAVIGFGVGYVFFFTDLISIEKPTPKKQAVTPDMTVFEETDRWVPEVVWSPSKPATEQIYYGTVKGVEETGTLVNREGVVEHFEDHKVLEKLGYKEDLNLSADGPGSSMWGYSKEAPGGLLEVVTFSYINEDMHPSTEGPLTASCPCTLTLKVFVSEPFKPNWK